MKIMVVGGSGMLGAPVVQQLLEDGHQVRVMSRQPEALRHRWGGRVEVVAGDVEQPDSLGPALAGCQGLHINLGGGPRWRDYLRTEVEGTRHLAQAARQVGVQQVSLISGMSLYAPSDRHRFCQAKLLSERIIQDSGLDFIFFRPSWYMESLPKFFRGTKALLIGRLAHPLRWVAAADYAKMVGRAFAVAAARGQIFPVVGPQGLTMGEALQHYALDRGLDPKLSRLGRGLGQTLAALSFSPALADLANLLDYFDRWGEAAVSPAEAERILGTSNQTTLAQWLVKTRPV